MSIRKVAMLRCLFDSIYINAVEINCECTVQRVTIESRLMLSFGFKEDKSELREQCE